MRWINPDEGKQENWEFRRPQGVPPPPAGPGNGGRDGGRSPVRPRTAVDRKAGSQASRRRKGAAGRRKGQRSPGNAAAGPEPASARPPAAAGRRADAVRVRARRKTDRDAAQAARPIHRLGMSRRASCGPPPKASKCQPAFSRARAVHRERRRTGRSPARRAPGRSRLASARCQAWLRQRPISSAVCLVRSLSISAAIARHSMMTNRNVIVSITSERRQAIIE